MGQNSSDRLNQEARIAILEHYTSKSNHWCAILLSVAVAGLAVFSSNAYDVLARLRVIFIAMTFVAFQGLYALFRLLWYGLLLRHVLCACPRALGVSASGLKQGQKETYIYRLDKGANDLAKKDQGGSFLCLTHSLPAWALWTAAGLAVGILLQIIAFDP